MTKRVRIITSPEHPSGLALDSDTGKQIPGVWAADLSLSVGNLPEAHLHLRVVQVDVTTEHVRWFGLDQVPRTALVAELERRDAHPPEVTG